MRSSVATRLRGFFSLALAMVLACSLCAPAAWADIVSNGNGSDSAVEARSDIQSESADQSDPSIEYGADEGDPVSSEGTSGSDTADAASDGSTASIPVEDVEGVAPIAGMVSAATTRTYVLPAATLSNFSVATIVSGTVQIAPETVVDETAGEDNAVVESEQSIPTISTTFVAEGCVYVLDRETGEFTLVNAASAELTEEGYLLVPSALILDDVTYPVISIAAGALSGTDAVLVALSKNINNVDDDALAGADDLQAVYVSEKNDTYSSYDGCLYDKPLTSLLLVPEGKLGTVRIPSGAETIDPKAFSHCAFVDAVFVDADSAAFQTLEDVTLYNSENQPIEVTIAEKTTDQTKIDFDKAISSDVVDENVVVLNDQANAGNAEQTPVMFSSIVPLSAPNIKLYICTSTGYTWKNLINNGYDSVGAGVTLLFSAATSFSWNGSCLTVKDSGYTYNLGVGGFTTGITSVSYSTSLGGNKTSLSSGGGLSTLNSDTWVWVNGYVLTHTVTWNANGGTCNTPSTPVEYGKTTKAPSAGKSGSWMTGWYTAASGGTKVCDAGGSTPAITGNVTYYAQYRQYHTIYFGTANGCVWLNTENGGYGSLGAGSYQIHGFGMRYRWTGSYIEYVAGGYVYRVGVGGYTQGVTSVSYSTSLGGTKTTIAASTDFRLLDSDIYLWINGYVQQYTVTWNANGGTCNTPSTLVEYGKTTKAPSAGKDGSWMTGWYTAASGGTKVCDAGGSTPTITSNVIYYAQWRQYYKFFLCSSSGVKWLNLLNGGDGAKDGGIASFGEYGKSFRWTGEKLVIVNGAYTYDVGIGSPTGGITAVSYSTSRGGTRTPLVANNGFDELNSDIYLWINGYEGKCTVTWNANGGSCDTSSTVVEYGETTTAPTPSRSYHDFLGWFDAEKDGTKVCDGDATTPAIIDDCTYYAQWEPYKFTCRLFANDGTNSAVDKTMAYERNVAAVEVPKRYGYVFNGYYLKEADGSKGAQYFDTNGNFVKDSAEGVWNDAQDIDLYAGWTLIGNLDVPINSPGEVSFAVDAVTGDVIAAGQTSGAIKSAMPEDVPLSSIELEALSNAGVLALTSALGEGNEKLAVMKVSLGTGATKPLLHFVDSEEEGETTRWDATSSNIVVPKAVALSADSTASGTIVTDSLGNQAIAGELPVSYALTILSGFDPTKAPSSHAATPVGRLVFTVDLTGLASERF